MGTMTRTISTKNDSLLKNYPNSTAATNDTVEDVYYDEFYEGIFDPKADVVPIVLAVLIVLINSLVLILMARKKYLRSITNLLLCSLAVSDLLTGLVSVPLFLTCSIVRQSEVCIIQDQMSRFIAVLIVCHLMCVTTDRYLAIIHPLHYSSLVTRPRCIVVILVVWSVSAVTALVQLSWLDPFHDPHVEPSEHLLKAELIYDVIFIILFFFIPMVLMLFSYARIVIEIARQSRNIHQSYLPSFPHSRSRNRHERKAVVIFASMMLAYVICWLPYIALRRFDYTKVPIPLAYVIYWLRFLASLLNPCIYILGKQDFRKALFEHQLKLELNFTNSSKSVILKNTLATPAGKNEKILMKSFSRIDSKKRWNC